MEIFDPLKASKHWRLKLLSHKTTTFPLCDAHSPGASFVYPTSENKTPNLRFLLPRRNSKPGDENLRLTFPVFVLQIFSPAFRVSLKLFIICKILYRPTAECAAVVCRSLQFHGLMLKTHFAQHVFVQDIFRRYDLIF